MEQRAKAAGKNAAAAVYRKFIEQQKKKNKTMTHVFLLFVFVGIGDDKKLISNDMYFKDLNECVWYAQTLHKQGNLLTAYCVPKFITEGNVKVY